MGNTLNMSREWRFGLRFLRNENGTMDVRSYEAGQDKKWKNKRDNENGGNHIESPGKEVEVVWACGEKRGA